MNTGEMGTGTMAGRHRQEEGKTGDGAIDGGMQSHQEGTIAKMIEEQTAKLPSDVFMWAAIGGMATSAIFKLTGHEGKSRFFGQWVAPLLLFGVYNKLVKQHGSDKTETVH